MEVVIKQLDTKYINNATSNIGWNNFDADVKRGYKFKPAQDWPGLYIYLYCKDANDITVATTDPTQTGVTTIDEAFEKLFVTTNGTIDRVDVTDDFKIIRYKTWQAGKASGWITYPPNI